MNKLRMRSAVVALGLGAMTILPGCSGGFYADSAGNTCLIVFVVPICL